MGLDARLAAPVYLRAFKVLIEDLLPAILDVGVSNRRTDP